MSKKKSMVNELMCFNSDIKQSLITHEEGYTFIDNNVNKLH